MTSISTSVFKALVVAVICVPLLAYQLAEDDSRPNITAASITSQTTDDLINPSDEPKIAAASPADTWTLLPDIKNARFESTAVQYRDDLYVFNGFGAGIKIEPAVEKFDAGTQSWSVISTTSIPQGNAVTHNGVIVHGNEVWIIGGRLGHHPGAVTAKVWKFNLTTHNWSQGPQLPAPVAAGGAALVDNRIHWFGGLDANAQCDVANHYVYDLDNPSAGWSDISSIAPMPIPRNHFATVVHKGLIYAIGGQFTHDGCGPGTPDTNLVHVFDPETEIWTQKASLPAVQSHIEPSTFVHKGAIYVVGGATNGNKVYRYDPTNDNWDTVAELPQALLAPVARVIDNQLIVSSGGAPSIIPSMATYATDMNPLLLPGVETTNSDYGAVITEIDPDPATDLTNEPGLVTLEAEYYDTLSATATHQWVPINLADASNNAAMTTTPDNGKLANDSQGSPSMAYFAYFDRPGTWYLWVRGWGDSNEEGSSDSLHAGLNGSLSATADKIDKFPSSWNWSSNTRDGVRASLEVPSAGIHAVNLWMREDGLAVDKILLTTDSTYQPSGKGDTPSDNGPSSDSEQSTGGDSITDDGTPINIIVANDDVATEDTTTDTVEDTSNEEVADNPTEETPVDSSEATATDTNQNTGAADNVADDSDAATNNLTTINGIVAIEVESFETTTSASNKQWVRSLQSGASGNASMVTTPDTGVLKNSNQGSPVMNYPVYFNEAGNYTVWLRGWGDTIGNEGKSDSVHVGINGTLGSAAAIQNFPPKWHWSSKKRSGASATIVVPSPGLHTINIWMREDGLILDKLILASNPAYTPSDEGPAVTTLAGGTSENAETSNEEPIAGTVENVDVPENDTEATANATIDEGLISVEVESYASKSASGAHQWLKNNTPGASDHAMEATPNTGKLSTNANGSAVLNYPLLFSEAGTYTVWLRGWGDSDGAGRNDSVYVGINNNHNNTQILENFPGDWTWSNKKRGGGNVTVTIPTAGTHVLNLSMREDGIILDKLILTKDTSFVPANLGPDATAKPAPATTPDTADTNAALTENFVAIRIEAEDFTTRNERWVLTSPDNTPNFQDDPDAPHNNSASGKANLELLPDTRVTHSDPISGGLEGSFWGNPGPGPSIDYVVNIPQAGRYLVYVKAYSTGSEDNGLHVGINGSTPDSGKRIQTCAKNKWIWTSAQRTNEEHCGVPKQIWLDVPVAGSNKITFYAREDGFELDQFLLLKETHDGTLDCFPTFGDEIRCENKATGAKVSDTDLPVSTTVGSNDTSSNTNSAGNTKFSNQWQNQYTADGSAVQKRHEAGGVALNGKLYLLGGRGARNVSVYDPITNKWSHKAAPPLELNHFQPVAYNNKIWVIGAFTGPYPNEISVADIYTYTPASNTWAKEGTIPQNRRRGSTAAVVHEGFIYIVGGNTNGHNPGAKPWLDRFNLKTGQWQTLSDAPTARDHITASISNNQLVVAAGRQSAYPNVFANTIATTNIYDFKTQNWSIGKSIPTQRAGAMTVTVGQEVVVIGGEVGTDGNAENTVESYNIINNTWRQLSPLQIGRHSGAAVILNDSIHVISGSEKKGGSPESTAHEVLNF